jgi:renalase
MQPVIALLLGLEAPLDVDFDGAFVNTGSLSWIARDSSKPGRPDHEAWVLHAGPDWSRARWDADREETIELLLAEFARVTGTPPSAAAHRDLHRWRYALAQTPLDPAESGGCLADDLAGLILCGDWCAGSRLEGAFLSGQAAAGRLLRKWRIRV